MQAVDRLTLVDHRQCLVITALLDALGAALTEVVDEDTEQAAGSLLALLAGAEDGVGVGVGEWQLVEYGAQLPHPLTP